MKLFEDCVGKATKDQINNFEDLIGYRLPEMYKEVVSQCDGGCPVNYQLVFFDNLIQDYDIDCIGRFFSFSKTSLEENTVFEEVEHPAEFFPGGLVVFAVDPFGNYFCFDYRKDPKTDNPPVVFWNHEGAGTEKAISFLSKDFESFLGMLKSEEEAEKEYQRLTKSS